MKRSTFIIALAWCFSATLQGQALEEGTWTGTRARANRNNPNPQQQRVSIEIKKAPDPHSAWRPEKREVFNVVYITPQGRFQASDVQVGTESLSFTYQQDIQWNCRADRQADGNYQGDCVGDGEARRFRLTLTPPKRSQ